MVTIKQLNDYVSSHPQFNGGSDIFMVLSAMSLEKPEHKVTPRDNPFEDSKVEYSYEDVCKLFG